jgi:hypothetical protein
MIRRKNKKEKTFQKLIVAELMKILTGKHRPILRSLVILLVFLPLIILCGYSSLQVVAKYYTGPQSLLFRFPNQIFITKGLTTQMKI